MEPDRPRHLTGMATWDRDILNVNDVDRVGDDPNDPLPSLLSMDSRTVDETGEGVHVAVIDTGLIKNWRDFLDEDRVATDLARAFMGGGAVAEDFVPVNSSRAIPELGDSLGVETQELDVLAPGLWTVAPCFSGPRTGLCFWGGTSFSAPLTAGVVVLMLEKNPGLTQDVVEGILTSTALPVEGEDDRQNVLEPFIFGEVYAPSWDTNCGTDEEPISCDPVGAGLVDGQEALEGTTPPP